MKYELIKSDKSSERDVFTVGEHIGGTPITEVNKIIDPSKYEITVTIGIHPTNGIDKDFSEDIIVVIEKSKRHTESDVQINEAVQKFMDEINA